MTRFLFICLGGAVGTGARYLTALWAAETFGRRFPAGTLIVNVLGSFLIGFVMEIATSTSLLRDDVRLILTSGVMGGFTTYSAFNYETIAYARSGAVPIAALNVAATLLGCLAAGLAGIVAARLVVR